MRSAYIRKRDIKTRAIYELQKRRVHLRQYNNYYCNGARGREATIVVRYSSSLSSAHHSAFPVSSWLLCIDQSVGVLCV